MLRKNSEPSRTQRERHVIYILFESSLDKLLLYQSPEKPHPQ